MKIEILDSIPPNGSNPYEYDFFNMGTQIGNNIMVMYDKHNDKKANYIIIIDMETGYRIRISEFGKDGCTSMQEKEEEEESKTYELRERERHGTH